MANLLIALIELFEAEAREFRKATIATGFAIGLLIFAGLVTAAGIALVGWALYQYVAAQLGAMIAALIVGIIAAVSGGVVLWRIYRKFQ